MFTESGGVLEGISLGTHHFERLSPGRLGRFVGSFVFHGLEGGVLTRTGGDTVAHTLCVQVRKEGRVCETKHGRHFLSRQAVFGGVHSPLPLPAAEQPQLHRDSQATRLEKEPGWLLGLEKRKRRHKFRVSISRTSDDSILF